MSPLSKREYFKSIKTRYQGARLKTKSAILDEFCANCGYNRKYAIRKLGKPRVRNPRSVFRRKPAPQSRYNRPEILKPLEEIWLTSNLPCSKRLKTILGLWMPSYESTFGAVTQEVKKAEKLENFIFENLERVSKDRAYLDSLVFKMFRGPLCIPGNELSLESEKKLVEKIMHVLEVRIWLPKRNSA